jgi:threonylcarbamoyladenosine tRNA methylthiotransferase MtaB
VHSCAVTAEAERQARQTVAGCAGAARRAHRRDRLRRAGVGRRVRAMPRSTTSSATRRSFRPETWRGLAAGEVPRTLVGDIMAVRETAPHLVDGFDGRTRAFLEVQQGCDHRCTFCVIPYGRGPSRSVPVERIAAQARALVANGYKEVVSPAST